MKVKLTTFVQDCLAFCIVKSVNASWPIGVVVFVCE